MSCRGVCVVLVAALALAGCAPAPQARPDARQVQPRTGVQHPEWVANAAIYELNTRQFTPQGTLTAAAGHLPRLRDLGVDIVWLMPIHEIGVARRKGTLGSPYAVRDYYSVNPELGTLDDLRRFVEQAHELGMYVILDWVANHTAWDNPLIDEHPEWYTRTADGQMTHPPDTDWTDVADLDYGQPGLRRYMTEALKYWVRAAGVDGYRCDVAGLVPLDFWDQARAELDAIKPVFMLAEWESPDLHERAFDMSYAWSWYSMMHEIAQGKTGAGALADFYTDDRETWPPDSIRMTFVSNHDENSWNGTQFEQFGAALEAAIVLSVAGEGMPLLYSGQEAGNPRRLAFFEKDEIDWREHPTGDLYRRLFALLEDNTAIYHGAAGAPMQIVPNDAPGQVFSFVRRNRRDAVFAVMNFSARPVTVRFERSAHHGPYRDYFSGESTAFAAQRELTLEPWAYRLFVR